MNRCINCRHWGGTPDREWEVEALAGLQECDLARVPYEHDEEATEPTEPKARKKRASQLRHPRSLMAAAGAERGSVSRLYTAEDFGCVHWDGEA